MQSSNPETHITLQSVAGFHISCETDAEGYLKDLSVTSNGSIVEPFEEIHMETRNNISTVYELNGKRKTFTAMIIDGVDVMNKSMDHQIGAKLSAYTKS